jgi:hypothetical protein
MPRRMPTSAFAGLNKPQAAPGVRAKWQKARPGKRDVALAQDGVEEEVFISAERPIRL